MSVVYYAGLVYSAIDLEEINDVTNLGCVQCSLLKFKYDFLQYVQHLPKRIKKKKKVKTGTLSSCKNGIYESPEGKYMAICLI